MAKRPGNTGSAGRKDSSSSDGGYIILNGQRLKLTKHPTDFSVVAPASAIADKLKSAAARTDVLSDKVTRMSAKNASSRDLLMKDVRREKVAHHVYQVTGTDEEVVIDDRIFLELQHEDPDKIAAIIREYNLVPLGRMGNAYVLRVTEATGMNPLKTANSVASQDGVASCSPQVLVPLELHQLALSDTHRLIRQQWYLTADLITDLELDPSAGIQAPEAWEITQGTPDIVIAIIDDGFDLDHPAFRNKQIHPARRDFAVLPRDDDPRAEGRDYHGTCVASIATGSLDGGGMVGVAPDCTLLPIRIGFGPFAAPVDILEVFKYVSRYADVLNCSFGTPPSSIDRFTRSFRDEITQLTMSGGRRGKGLVLVFSAANDDAPTRLRASQNKNGVKFVSQRRLREIPPGREVYSGYPLTRGVIVVGAVSSLKRKSGYSCWGPHLTVTAPSNNMHYIPSFVPPGVNDAVRNKFVANYRGLGQVAAVNRPGHGQGFPPLRDDPITPEFREDFYTVEFGGTSGAAPIVTGVAALMLSVNPSLTAEEVRQILMATADKDLDPTLDLVNDPNVQELSGSFTNGRSLFFGAGKVNALRAVRRARALLDGRSATRPATDRKIRPPLRATADAVALQGLRVEAFSSHDGRFIENGVGHWQIAGPHFGEATHGDARVIAVGPDGTIIREYDRDAALAEFEDPKPGKFAIRTRRYPPQVGHAPYHTELALGDPTLQENGASILILLSTTPITTAPVKRIQREQLLEDAAVTEAGLLRPLQRDAIAVGTREQLV